MDIILVDTSVWVNFFKGIETESSKYLKNNLANIVVATCPTVVQEILQGIVSESELRKVKSYFDSMTKLVEDPYKIAVQAATLYRDLRRKGVTIRKANDCLIALYAINNKIALLHDDKDFHFIAQNSTLRTVEFN
ncbi:type II toxin-antitoxin system VapC family toxin [Mucilaginibacter kameinonensis]|uniref:type II toxin-antitoxin system VapC family toxin n=1 Tax=Mucilaginibacter kameinonensis TaxID=452286 RepID=UPI000EF812D6|nr:PIN domain-containing protein [Mucilaginibacter kameinonensis]